MSKVTKKPTLKHVSELQRELDSSNLNSEGAGLSKFPLVPDGPVRDFLSSKF